MFGRKLKEYVSLNDEDLMLCVSKGESAAFETLYDRYFNKLVWFASRITLDVEVAKDIIQEVFILIIEKPEKFDVTKKFSTWVYVVSSNQCKQHLRNKNNRERILKEVTPAQTLNADDNKLDAKRFNDRVAFINEGLSEKEKSIYSLRFEQELSIKEIAEVLLIPEGSVKSGIFYLLKKYANHLKDFKHD
jgi:RNA polymerase sigma-70 factor, ECF subfamily